MHSGLLKFLGPLTKPVLHRYWLVSRGVTLGVRCAAYTPKMEICLVSHTYVDGWFLPGGGVDPGETIYQAAKRELLEETGIILESPPQLVGIYANSKASLRDHVALLICREWRQGPPTSPNHEIAEVGFFRVDDLPATTTQGTRSKIAELQGDAAPSHHW